MLYLTGIHEARQLRGFDPAKWPGIRRRIAIDLIDDIDALGDPTLREALFERIVDVRGTFKRTYSDRFADFDALLMRELHATAPRGEVVRVLDAGVSDGSTSVALIDAVARFSEGRFDFTATDLDGLYVGLCRREAPQRRVILNSAGQIVQIIVPPFLFTHRESRVLFPLNRMLRPAAQRFAHRLIADWRTGAGDVQATEILLLAPPLRQRIARDTRVRFRTWDLLDPWPGETAGCVRAMNVLNPGYFDERQMLQVVGNLFSAITDGGLLAMGSNENAGTPVDGVICRRVGARLSVLATSGNEFRSPAALAGFLHSQSS